MINASSTTCVIGDIHGCNAALTVLLQQVQHRADTIVFLGDYVDRGPQSKEVVATILSLQKTHPRVVPLMGNHDFLFLQYLEGRDSSVFLQVGGLQTLASYGLHPAEGAEAIKQRVPLEHIAFFRSLSLFWHDQHGIYVHAGLEPGRHLSQQTSHWCLWAREQFLQSRYNFGKPVVFGHTVFDDPFLTADKIGIDTGAVYNGKLSALLLPMREVVSVPGNPDTR
ncbi:metallophosphoesterase [Desulfobulbus propionicus DSM 2032]|jgi:serine/threonine protein phosphatase 1|uniref:Metallophosphoesterase n=1 Tax=Desulfobulbus propionicus (strain ATCC 33891 / DSM 2032 / VKM B-1956 / 1pr3) TaxID=577650 RepID=A0A7U3YNS3_DESPD|nr:metallophosphoesterase family protein [Desulfobulbus propionicus]ADW18780.1 metallophosphoesterase [Desulfobulbus propionicus DSM 2032]